MRAPVQPTMALLALACAGVVNAQSHRREMLPPEVASQFSPAALEGFGEPPLWPAEARRDYRSRFRLTITGILLIKVSIRIDERANGRLDGYVVFVDRGRRPGPHGRTERRFSVSRARFDALQQAFQRAALWHLYPEFYPMSGDNFCIDGMELIFERADANGYRFSNANAQCTAPRAMIEAAEQVIEIAGERRARAWIH